MPPLTFSVLQSPAARRRFLRFAAVYILIWIATWYSASVLATLGVASLWYLPSGLRFVCLLALGGLGLALEVATALVLLLLQLAFGSTPAYGDLAVQILAQAYNVLAFALAYALAVMPLRRRLGDSLDFTQPWHSFLFLATALLASALSAAAGTAQLRLASLIAQDQWPAVFISWMTGDFIGVITLAPLLLVLVWPRVRHYLRHGLWAVHPAQAAEPLKPTEAAKPRDGLLVALMVLLSLALVLGLPRLLGLQQLSPMLALLLLIPLATVAMRYRLRGAVLATVLLDSGLVLAVALLEQQAMALQYQLVMVALALVGLWLGGTVEAYHRLVLRLKDFSAVSNDLLWETNAFGVLHTSGRLSELLSYAPGQSWRAVLAPVAQPGMVLLEQARARREPFSRLEIALRNAGGEPRWVSASGIPLWDAEGEFAGYRGTAADISDAVQVKALQDRFNQALQSEVAQRTAELHRRNAELAIKEQHLRVLLAAAPVGVLELDEAGCCRYLNSNGSIMTGRTLEQARGLYLLDFVHPEDRERVQQALRELRQMDTVHSLEFRLNGSNIWCAATWIRTTVLGALAASTVVVLVDSTLQHQQAERLWTMAHTDLLTGLANRNLFQDRCNQALTLAKRHTSLAALLWIDLDGFKAVNDTLGHAAGDALLQQVALRLKNRMRLSDTVARIGGDEFAVILTEISDPDAAEQIASLLLASLCQTYDLPQGSVQISASIGIALYPQHAEEVNTLMRCADIAMYSAKHAGKKRIQTWNPSQPWTESQAAALDANTAR
jgi:diguanylate cyclase (GGDEF)-like protein/PAS domain S-box-containing protein